MFRLRFGLSLCLLFACNRADDRVRMASEEARADVDHKVSAVPIDSTQAKPKHAGTSKARDIIPGWDPCPPIPGKEITFAEGTRPLVATGRLQPAPGLPIPRIPKALMADWEELPPLDIGGVPRGYWWKPEDPKLDGIWFVLAIGYTHGSAYTVVTAPRTYRDFAKGLKMSAKAVNDLAAALAGNAK